MSERHKVTTPFFFPNHLTCLSEHSETPLLINNNYDIDKCLLMYASSLSRKYIYSLNTRCLNANKTFSNALAPHVIYTNIEILVLGSRLTAAAKGLPPS